MSFDSFNLHPNVMAGVNALGYVTPTPIQLQAIPPVMQGKDLIGLAQTGTGKTAAFMLPILHRLLQSRRGRIGALVITPTRELAEQVCEVATDLGQKTGLRAISIYGGVSMDQQIRKLRAGVEIVVACPGRLMDHLLKGNISLSDLQVLVIDEADRMFDMGFLPDIRSILRCIMKPRQTLLFSATMPDNIRNLVKDVMRDPVTVQIGHILPAETVSHALYPVSQHLKTSLLKQLLRKTDTESVLVFTRTKRRAERVAEQLKSAGCRVASLQGDLSQNQRQYALDGFRTGLFKVLVATDIAARGIDILDISHVINYDMPENADAYIHRIGRTGRVGKAGEAFTFVTGEDKDMVRSLEQLLNTKIERRTLEDFDYKAPAPSRDTNHRPQEKRPQEKRKGAIMGFARNGGNRRFASSAA